MIQDSPVAEYWEKLTDDRLVCKLCPNECHLGGNTSGICGARKNIDGTLRAVTYGLAPGCAIDPIEKKPLYHFLPGSAVLSLGHNSCNLSCQFCQNWEVSQNRDTPVNYYSPQILVDTAIKNKTKSIAFTYTEPTTWFEYIRDVVPIAKAANIKLILVTNGYINPEPLDRLLNWIDAANLDIKAFDDSFYRKLCAGSLKPVLDTATQMSKKIHLEITYLMIPKENDAPGEVGNLAKWMADELGTYIPFHISRYHPAYRHHSNVTPAETLLRAREEAMEYLEHVYIGNFDQPGLNDTLCSKCNNLLISRNGYSTRVVGIADGKCDKCGNDEQIIF